MKNQQENNT